MINGNRNLIYIFEVTDGYEAKVELDFATSVVYYSINGGNSEFGGVGLPIICYNDFEYANYKISSRDVNGDGYEDVIIANEQSGILVEEVSYFNPSKVQFEKQDHLSRSEPNLKGTQGFIVLDFANNNFDDGEKFLLQNEDNTIWLDVYCRNIHNIPEYLNTIADRKQYINWLKDFNPWLYLYGERERIVFRYLKEEKNSYTVIVNENTGETKKLQKMEGLDIYSIEEYLKKSVISFNSEKQSLRNKPNKDATTVALRDEASGEFDIIEIMGDWAHITDRVDETIPGGWIRWREDNKLTVTTYYYYE